MARTRSNTSPSEDDRRLDQRRQKKCDNPTRTKEMDPDIEKSALLTSSSSPSDTAIEGERTPILESAAPPRKRKYAFFLLIIILVPSAIFCAYTYQNIWLAAARRNLHLFGSAPTSTPSFAGEASIRLHPEEHVFRKTKTITQHWHVTKERRAPDGVWKDVFLINGISNTLFESLFQSSQEVTNDLILINGQANSPAPRLKFVPAILW